MVYTELGAALIIYFRIHIRDILFWLASCHQKKLIQDVSLPRWDFWSGLRAAFVLYLKTV